MAAACPALILAPGNAVFPCMNLALACDPLPVTRVSVHRWESLCMGLSKGHIGFQSSSVSPRWPKSLLVFTVRIFRNSSSLGWDSELNNYYFFVVISFTFTIAVHDIQTIFWLQWLYIYYTKIWKSSYITVLIIGQDLS